MRTSFQNLLRLRWFFDRLTALIDEPSVIRSHCVWGAFQNTVVTRKAPLIRSYISNAVLNRGTVFI